MHAADTNPKADIVFAIPTGKMVTTPLIG